MIENSNQPILRNNRFDEKLLADGYVVVPFLNEDEVTSIVKFYYDNHSADLDGLYATAHVSDISFRLKMNEEIKKVFARAIQDTFVNCTPLGGSFIAKGKGEMGTLQPHQDWNIVDEDKFRSFNIWVPLVDLNENNGAIKVLPRSHSWIKSYRSANISSAFGQVNDTLLQKMVTLFMHKGEALIYDHRLLHASGANSTDEIRLAAVYGIIPQEAQMFYYHQGDEETVEVFESNTDFFLYGNIFEGPKGLQQVNKFKHEFEQVTEARLHEFLNDKRDSEPKLNKDSFLQKLRRLWK